MPSWFALSVVAGLRYRLLPDMGQSLSASASQRPDLTPVYSFNGDGLWLAEARGDAEVVKGGSGIISLWRKLVSGMGKEFD